MQRMKQCALTIAMSLGFSAAYAAPVSYTIDPDHTDVVTTWSHLGFSKPIAHFGDVAGTIVYDPTNVSGSSVTVTIPLTGLSSHVEKFDQHLHSAELFDTETFPTITFRSTSVESTGDRKLKVTGDLTVRGITDAVVLDVTLNGQGEHPMAKRLAIGFDATAAIKRSTFGVAYAVPAVSDEVAIRITTEALVPEVAK